MDDKGRERWLHQCRPDGRWCVAWLNVGELCPECGYVQRNLSEDDAARLGRLVAIGRAALEYVRLPVDYSPKYSKAIRAIRDALTECGRYGDLEDAGT